MSLLHKHSPHPSPPVCDLWENIHWSIQASLSLYKHLLKLFPKADFPLNPLDVIERCFKSQLALNRSLFSRNVLKSILVHLNIQFLVVDVEL